MFGRGFLRFRPEPRLASCQWDGGITTPTFTSDRMLVCPSAKRVGESETTTLRVSTNGVHFVDTNYTFLYFTQPANFSAISPRGGALDSGTMVTVHGEGFLAFSPDASKVRCRWGLDTNGTMIDENANGTMHDTVAVQLQADHIVCAAHPKANAGTRQLYLSLNSVDFGLTGLSYK